MKEEYRDQDYDQQRYNVYWLIIYHMADRESRNLSEYIYEYHQVSSVLWIEGKITKYIQGLWFLEGLPRDIQQQALKELKLDVQDDQIIKYKKVQEFTKGKIKAGKLIKFID